MEQLIVAAIVFASFILGYLMGFMQGGDKK